MPMRLLFGISTPCSLRETPTTTCNIKLNVIFNNNIIIVIATFMKC